METLINLGGQPQLTSLSSVVVFPERGNVKHLFDDGDLHHDEYKHIWLFHAQSGLCGMLLWGNAIQINNRDVNRLAVLQHGDQVQIGERRWTYQDIFSGVAADGSALSTCGYCISPFANGQVFIRCPLCFAIYHDDCWRSLELKRCCTRGCRLIPNKIEVQRG
jgi:hypothetical protein